MAVPDAVAPFAIVEGGLRVIGRCVVQRSVGVSLPVGGVEGAGPVGHPRWCGCGEVGQCPVRPARYAFQTDQTTPTVLRGPSGTSTKAPGSKANPAGAR